MEDEWSLVELLARKGIFLRDIASLVRNGERISSVVTTGADLDSRSYGIRRACEADLLGLLELERVCWAENLRLDESALRQRLQDAPASQWVATARDGGAVIGAMYTSRIASYENLRDGSTTFETQRRLLVASGARAESLQLLGVAVLPAFANLSIGTALRDFALLHAKMNTGYKHVVAMTRCSAYDGAMNYSDYVFSCSDPTIKFHVDGGAAIVAVVPGYRVKDTQNKGHAVLIKYELYPAKPTSMAAVQETLPESKESSQPDITAEELMNLCSAILGYDLAAKMKPSDFASTPFMSLGMDSLQLMELSSRMQERVENHKMTPLLFFEHATPYKLLNFLLRRSVDDAPSESKAHRSSKDEYFAITAVSCRFPGTQGPTPEEYYASLCSGQNLVTELPKDWRKSAAVHNSMFPKGAVFLNDSIAQSFDPAFFGLGDAEAAIMDPHQRVLLELAHEALVNANAIESQEKDSSIVSSEKKIGVFVGLCNNEWMGLEGRSRRAPGSYTGTAVAQSSAANRISFTLGLDGPSMVVDTACSSSLSALHVACNALRAGDCTHALVAAADLILSPYSLEVRAASHMLSPDSACKTFDASANGYVRGEGGGAVVLRRLSDVEADLMQNPSSPERILAVIRSVSINQDGKSASFTAPNGLAQRSLISNALKMAKVDPQDVVYVETHGTGTSLGDPVEWAALRDAYQMNRSNKSNSETRAPLIIGAVKTNIGHLEGAAGMAGLIKVVLCLQAGAIPANRNLVNLNPLIDLNNLSREPLFPNKMTPLKPSQPNSQIYAGLSSFGSGGTNVHVILQGYDDGKSVHRSRVNRLGKADFNMTRSRESSYSNLDDVANEKTRSLSSSSIIVDEKSAQPLRISLMFGGQGSQHVDMGLELFTTEEVFRNTVKLCSDVFDLVRSKSSEILASCSHSLIDVMYPGVNADISPGREEAELMIRENSFYAQASLYTYEVALTKLWVTRGVHPNTSVIGHSLGEFAALVSIGVLTVADGAMLVCRRAFCIEKYGSAARHSAGGVMFAARASMEDATSAINSVASALQKSMVVDVAASNGPKSVVLSGLRDDVLAVLKVLGCSFKELSVTHAFHSQLLSEAAKAFGLEVANLISSGVVKFSSPSKRINFISSVTGSLATHEQVSNPEYWSNQIIEPVRFFHGINTLSELHHAQTCIEVGPRLDLLKLAPNCLPVDPDSAAKFDFRWIGSSSPIFCKSGTTNTRAQFDAAVAAVFRHNSAMNEATMGGGRNSPHYQPRSIPWRVADLSTYGHSVEAAGALAPSNPRIRKQTDLQELITIIKSAILSVVINPAAASILEPDTSLLSLGIDSLGAIEIRNRIFSALNERFDIPSTLLLTHPSISMMANFLKDQEESKEQDPSDANEGTEESDSAASEDFLTYSKLLGSYFDLRDIVSCFPATRVQQAMIYYHMISPQQGTFVESFAWQVTSSASKGCATPIDIQAFRRAWMDVVAEHACLRSSFDVSTSPVLQVIWKHDSIGFDGNRQSQFVSSENTWFETEELSVAPEIYDNSVDGKCTEFIGSLVASHREKPFDLMTPVLFRVKLIKLVRLGDDTAECSKLRYVMLFSGHHTVIDGSSITVIMKSLQKHYKERSAPGASRTLYAVPRAPSYESFAKFELDLLKCSKVEENSAARKKYEEGSSYWADVLGSWRSVTSFTGMPKLYVDATDREVTRVRMELPSDLFRNLKAAAAAIDVTIASFVHAAWSLVHSSVASKDFSCYASTASGRTTNPVKGSGAIVGPLINTMPVIIAVDSSNRIVQHIQSVHKQLIASLAFENFPLTEMKIPEGVLRQDMTSVIVDFQRNDWNCDLVDEDDASIASHRQLSIRVRDAMLFDRICCPLTVRVVSSDSKITLFATSECKAYDESFLNSLMGAMRRSLEAVSSDIIRNSKMSTTAVGAIVESARLVFEIEDAFPAPVLPIGPAKSTHAFAEVDRLESDKKFAAQDKSKLAAKAVASVAATICHSTSSRKFSIHCKAPASLNCRSVYQFDHRNRVSPTFASFMSDVTQQNASHKYVSGGNASGDAVVINFTEVEKPLVAASSSLDVEEHFVIICLHPAGSNSKLFDGWQTELQSLLQAAGGKKHCHLFPLDLPGHGSRRGESLLNDVESLVFDIERNVKIILEHFNYNQFKLFFMGYSLGALLGYETALKFSSSFDSHTVHGLIVISEAAPMLCVPDIDPDLDDLSLLKAICADGWVSASVLEIYEEDPSSVQHLIDIARADLQVEKNYFWDESRKYRALSCPLSVFAGALDHNLFTSKDNAVNTMDTPSIKSWSKVSSTSTTINCIPGAKHMLMSEDKHRSKVLSDICSLLTPSNAHESFIAGALVCSIKLDESSIEYSIAANDSTPQEWTRKFSSTLLSSLNLALLPSFVDRHSAPLDSVIPAPTASIPVAPPCAVDNRLLHEGFWAHSESSSLSSSEAVVGCDESGARFSLSYSSLRVCSEAVSRRLYPSVSAFKRAHAGSGSGAGAGNSSVVAVVMEKGWEQVVAVLGIHKAQSTYLPIDAKLWPEHRVKQVVEMSGAVAVLCQGRLLSSLPWLSSMSVPVIDVNEVCAGVLDGSFDCSSSLSDVESLSRAEPSDLGYLIYTSGSTGLPKGVCCHHLGAMNTIVDLNERFCVGPSDRVLALSSLSFDLSVYDIFGLLTAGGKVVIPEAGRVSPPDPSEWFEMLLSEGITVWNTVPAFMELLVSHSEFTGVKLPSSLRLIFMSGDWVPVTLSSRIRAASACPDLRIISMGGATEAAVWSNMYELTREGSGIPPGWSSVPYGRPLRNQSMLILDEQYRHCEVWVTGVIYIGGVGVAHGYYRDPSRTAYQFVRHPETGELLFRTGDLGRLRPCGNLEILGREDSQVKVNGFRIELGEIEKVLMQHEGVASAALAVHNNTICAYIVVANKSESSDNDWDSIVADLGKLCKEKLTEYMIPKFLMRLSQLPLSGNGKLQREKLPPPQVVKQDSSESDNSSSGLTENERAVAEIWSAVLGVEVSQLSPSSNFFAIGGDSLRSIQIIAAGRKRGVVMSVTQIFDNPTLGKLAAVVTRAVATGPSVLGTSSSELSVNPVFTIDHEPSRIHEPYTLIGINQAHFVGLHTSSFSVNGISPQIYFEWEIGADERHPGQLNIARFEAAINCFLRRHPTFRAYVREDGLMQITHPIPKFKVTKVHEWNGSNALAAEAASKTKQDMMVNGPNPLKWPLFDCRVTHTGESQSILHVVVSLFLMDAMGDLILRQELSALYRALSKDPSLVNDEIRLDAVLGPPPTLLFRDYSIAQEEKLKNSEEYKRAYEFWTSRLDSFPRGPEIPLNPNSGKSTTGQFFNQHRWLSATEWRRAKSNCAAHSVTVPAMLLAVYSLTLARFSNKKRFLINVLQCLRHQVHEEVNKVVGNCSSTIICDINMEDNGSEKLSFLTAVYRVARELSQNLEHAVMSGIDVMQELNRRHGRTFNAVAPFIFTSPIGVEKGNKDVQTRDWFFQERFFSEKVPHTACVNAIKADPSGSACASIDIISGVYPDEVVQGMYNIYSKIFDIICSSDPSAWNQPLSEILPPAAPSIPVAPPCAVDNRLLHEGFWAHSESSSLSSREAVVGCDESGARFSLSYSSLRVCSEAVSRRLYPSVSAFKRAHAGSGSGSGAGAGNSSVVAVVMEKGWEQVVAVLGIHKAQSTYLPIDAKLWPEHRVKQVVEMSGAVAVLCQGRLLSSLPWLSSMSVPVIDVNEVCAGVLGGSFKCSSSLSDVESLSRADPSDLGYLIYTSGSTGLPKGVCCHHLGAMNTIVDLNERFCVGPSDRVLALSSLSFDLSVYDIFGLLTAGGKVVIPEAGRVSPPDPSEWFEMLSSEGITVWNTVPAFMELLVSHSEFTGVKLPGSLRLIFMSGDWVPVTLSSRIRAASACPDLRIISMGGATEAAVWSNMYELTREGSGIPPGWSSVPYGRPLRNQSMLILDEQYRHCEVWVTGVIYIGGVGVAHGYYRDPSRTAYQFVRHPETGELLFRTGDLGRLRPCGNLEILGREDSQVKVNGFRIELGEIEKVLMQHEGVASAALAVHNNTICAYIVKKQSCEDAMEAVVSSLKEMCKTVLTDYMIPKHFMELSSLPLSSNGKLQREKLPPPRSTNAGSDGGLGGSDNRNVVAPSSELERAVRATFSKVLGLEEESICCRDDTFFALGGNSITAIRLIFQLRKQVSCPLSVQDLFNHPTVCGLTSVLIEAISMPAASSTDSAQSKIFVIRLKRGDVTKPPIILINPAGASGACYSEFASHMSSDSSVYALDDNCVISGSSLSFSSIEDVASACLEKVIEISRGIALERWGSASVSNKVDVIVGGWSYGGVVASILSNIAVSSGKLTDQPVNISSLILFDPPLRKRERAAAETEDNHERILPTPAKNNSDSDASADDEAERNAHEHFEACTELLRRYHGSLPEKLDSWASTEASLLYVYPEHSDYTSGEGSAAELTRGPVTSKMSPGNHWTMLFGSNAVEAAKITASFLGHI